jgi:hypothetical protein
MSVNHQLRGERRRTVGSRSGPALPVGRYPAGATPSPSPSPFSTEPLHPPFHLNCLQTEILPTTTLLCAQSSPPQPSLSPRQPSPRHQPIAAGSSQRHGSAAGDLAAQHHDAGEPGARSMPPEGGERMRGGRQGRRGEVVVCCRGALPGSQWPRVCATRLTKPALEHAVGPSCRRGFKLAWHLGSPPRLPALPQSVFHVTAMRGLFPDDYYKDVTMKNLDGEGMPEPTSQLASSCRLTCSPPPSVTPHLPSPERRHVD